MRSVVRCHKHSAGLSAVRPVGDVSEAHSMLIVPHGKSNTHGTIFAFAYRVFGASSGLGKKTTTLD